MVMSACVQCFFFLVRNRVGALTLRSFVVFRDPQRYGVPEGVPSIQIRASHLLLLKTPGSDNIQNVLGRLYGRFINHSKRF